MTNTQTTQRQSPRTARAKRQRRTAPGDRSRGTVRPRTLNLSEDASKLAALSDSAPRQEAAMNWMNSRPTVARYGDNAHKR